MLFFFFSSRRRHTRSLCDWSSDVCSSDLENEDPDSQVIKTLLAITNSPKRRAEPYHIVAEIRERKNLEVARLVGGTEAQLIEAGDTISRVIVQTCRQTGLSVVYTALLDYGGDEIYFKEEPA